MKRQFWPSPLYTSMPHYLLKTVHRASQIVLSNTFKIFITHNLMMAHRLSTKLRFLVGNLEVKMGV